MDGDKAALERQRARHGQVLTRVEIPSFTSGRGMLDAPVVLRRVGGRTIQPPVRMGWVERLWRTVMGR